MLLKFSFLEVVEVTNLKRKKYIRKYTILSYFLIIKIPNSKF